MPVRLPILKPVSALAASLSRGRAPLAEAVGPWGSGKSAVAAQTAEALGVPLLVVAPTRVEAEAIHDDLVTFAGEDGAALFPAWEVLPTDTMDPADDIVAERMNTLTRLAKAAEAGRPVHGVFPVRALLQYVVDPGRLAAGSMRLEAGREYDLQQLLEQLVKMGYVREVMVEQRGEASVRGGIVDVFPIASELPYRIEFFGDEVDSIRRFEPETQRSVEAVDAFEIMPRSEKAMLSKLRDAGGLAAVTDYFPGNALVVFDEPRAVAEEAAKLDTQFAGSGYHLTWEEMAEKLVNRPRLDLLQVARAKRDKAVRVTAPMKSMAGWAGHIDEFWEQLKQWDLDGYTVRILCVNTGERRRLYELLEEQGYRPGEDAFDLRIEIGRLRAGFISAPDKLAVLSERELFGRHYIRRTRRRFEAGASIVQFSDLKAGDYIVHQTHGIGRYLGLRRFQGKAGDFMAIQYAGGDKVYVPATHIDQVQKYTGGDGAMPKVDKIGGATWRRTRNRVKKAVRDMTEELVKLYAERESREGFAYSPDLPWLAEFEEAFEYEETADQARSIGEVKQDLETARPMDRLLCGDVGYGKTEVALRAAFKAVLDGKQVALLAPTTVLTQQHYQTFSERMADYPVHIALLNRFRTHAQIKAAIEGMKSGEVDIVIGTHRLLSKDIAFKDLGLVIIDEEQRFGVAHKERLKQLRTHVDVLTMTATPIPRTLHFSMIGIRDMSVINTAPNDRLPIHTCIHEWDQNLVKEAVERELSRQGQVFFLHNRVQTIDKMAALVNKLVPTARVAIGHGQMPKHELEDVMAAFIRGEIDVLVCTTIIGSGIDIPNANTIVVNRADMFGLAELYQIRGRVGRYKHRAFAYLMVPGDKALSEDAMQRLKALEDFSALGSGFRIAMRDLEIRGCGNILGAEQSGHIAAVGYETYRQLIEEAVAELSGKPVRARALPHFEVAVDAYIPDDYVPTGQQKMTLYRRIANLRSPGEVEEMRDELQDRFGKPPRPVLRLLDIMLARALAAELAVHEMAATREHITIAFESARHLDGNSQRRMQQVFGGAVEFAWRDKPSLTHRLDGSGDPVRDAIQVLETLHEV